VPVYNVEKYLRKCTLSIINQTYENLEIICINDGSTDKSPDILDSIVAKDSRIRVVHQENRGLMSVRARGIREAKGEYIAFVDSDDYCKPNMMKTLVEAAVQNNADIAVSGFEVVDLEDKRLFCVTPKAKTLSKKEALKALIFEDYGKSGLYPVWNKLYKKELFEHYAPSKTVINLGEDQYMNLMMIDSANKVTFVPDICYAYVQHGASIMKTPKLSHIDDFFGLWEEKERFIEKLGLLNTNKKEVFEAYFTSVFDFYGLCYKMGKRELIPKFNEKLSCDPFFKPKNLPLSANIIARYVKFLVRRYL
jgi:glycosyltransferase EpsH